MPSAVDADEFRKLLIHNVCVTACELRRTIELARREQDGVPVDDEAILEGINECLSQVGFSVIRKPRSNASSGTDPWDR
jgi:hypothetical protein